jgi:hypothetical protein
VLFHLIRALPVAVIVGLAPGWFWARLLLRPADLYERIAYSIALSLALVAAVILVPTRLLGMEVTLGVAVASPLAVFTLGLAANLRYGAAKEPGEPIVAPRSLPLGTISLGLLAAAFGLGLGVVAGLLPRARFVSWVTFEPVPSLWLLPPIALLVLLAGGLQVRRARARKAAPPLYERAEPAPALLRQALPGVLILALVRGYAGPILHDWPFMRGVDLYSHAVMAQLMMQKGEIYPYLIYPMGFHTITAEVCRLSGLTPLEVFPVLAPLLLLLPALALYVLAGRLWGREYGVVAAFFSVLLGGPYYYYNDAMYPNLLTSQFLLVLAVGSLLSIYSSPTLRNVLLFGLLGSSIVLYHQVSSLYLAALLAVVGLFFLPYLLIKDSRRALALFSSMALVGILSVVYAWDTYHLGGAISGLVGGSGGSATDAAVSMAIGTQYPYLVVELIGNVISQPVAWLGLLGICLTASELRLRSRLPRTLAYLTLLLWTLLLVVGACTSESGFPQRFGRDLGMPVALFAAFAFIALLRTLPHTARHKHAGAVFMASLAVLSMLTLVGVRAASSLQSASAPSSRMTMTPQIAAAGQWLEEHNHGGNIMVSPHGNQVPSRMMLAMGGYSAMQSFDTWQIEQPRDLPPTGPKPLEDVLWVMRHPDDRRTAELLEQHDISYIVLYKNMPDRPTIDYWKGFEAKPGLYRTVFENHAVLIVTRK